ASLSERMLQAPPEQVEFTVPDRPDRKGNPMRLEFRIFSSGKSAFVVRSVRTWALVLLPIDGEGPAQSDASAGRYSVAAP
ncbi:MAG: hypothetical protein ACREFP_15700, partial [Acetobacteraceae bacterium]